MEKEETKKSFFGGRLAVIRPGSARRKTAALRAILAAAAGAAAYMFSPVLEKFSPPCVFHSLTGLHCAGCGATRALIALLHGSPAAAFGFNPLFIIVVAPVVLLEVLNEITIAAAGAGLRIKINPGARAAAITVLILVAYSVLRNIPVAPFSYLAP